MASLISGQIFQNNNNSSSVEDNNKSIGRKGARRLRLIFVKEVQKHKEDLFGKYSSLTHEEKLKKWEEIRQVCVEQGVHILRDRDAMYVSRTHWQNVRRASIDKFQKQDGNLDNWDEIDDIVLDIVGGLKQELVLTAAADVTANNSVSAELLAIADEPIVSSPSTSIGIATTTRNSLLHTSFITAARNVRLMDADESIQCAITSAHDESTEMKVNDVRVQQQAIDDCISSTFVDARNKRKYVELVDDYDTEYKRLKCELMREQIVSERIKNFRALREMGASNIALDVDLGDASTLQHVYVTTRIRQQQDVAGKYSSYQ